MKAEIINPFIVATIDVLETMANIKPERGAPRLKGKEDTSYDVSGIVGLTGQVQGCIVLSFRESAAIYVVTSFLGDKVEGIDDTVKDAVGELANIVAGAAKRALAESGYALKISIPSVIIGKNHSISRQSGIPAIEIPFETEAGPFSVELCLKLEE